jgi:hypothetical protein
MDGECVEQFVGDEYALERVGEICGRRREPFCDFAKRVALRRARSCARLDQVKP